MTRFHPLLASCGFILALSPLALDAQTVSVSAGVYSITVLASGSDVTRSTSYTLTVSSFGVSLSPTSGVITQGGATLSTTVSMNYSSGYNDEDHTTYTTIPSLQTRKIASYTTFNVVGTYTGIKDVTLTAGLINQIGRAHV